MAKISFRTPLALGTSSGIGAVPPRSRSASIEVAPVRGGEIVAAGDRAREAGTESAGRLRHRPRRVAPNVLPVADEERFAVAGDPALPPDAAAARAGREALDLARIALGNADDKAVIVAAIAIVAAVGNEDLAGEQRQRAALILY